MVFSEINKINVPYYFFSYTTDCPELQLRRLGDLWFLCRQWQRAFDSYHTAKREFYADSAWLCYAGALEMAAISAFMAGEANRKTHGYMEESIVTYLNTCRSVALKEFSYVFIFITHLVLVS